MIRSALFVTLCTLSLLAQDVRKLPDWAGRAVMAAFAETPPAEADAWVLLDRAEVAYAGEGEIRIRHLRVVRILDDRGLTEGTYFLAGLGGKASTVKRLKGWNLRPDGELQQLDLDSAVTFDADAEGEISTRVATGARLARVVKGSLVAFESLESLRHPMGPTVVTGIMQKHPVRRWELEAATSGGWFTNLKGVAIRLDARHLEPWIKASGSVSGGSVRVEHVPAIPKQEDAAPQPRNALPTVTVRFQDPDFQGGPSTETWDSMATWVDQQYQRRFLPSGQAFGGRGVPEGLRAIHQWMARELTYKQVYLSPERGWLPDPGPEVVRHRYGDCKDLASYLLGEAKGLGLEVHPVMALIGHGRLEEDEVPSFTAFDHVIGAIRLKESLGMPAEVETSRGRFLLVDPTSRFTPLGQLPAYLRDQRVMICTAGGAAWVRVPVSAVQAPHSRVLLEGEMDAARKGTATLRIQETADQLGLRSAAFEGGREELRRRLVAFLGLLPSGSLDLSSSSDPLDLSGPFTVSAQVVQPDILRLEGRDEVLVAWGLPPVPRIIQKAGQARRFPVEDQGQGRLELKAIYRLPFFVKPLLPAMETDTPFRTLRWAVLTEKEGASGLVTLTCTQERRPVRFDFADRNAGLIEWKRDRGQVFRLHNEGLAFRPSD